MNQLMHNSITNSYKIETVCHFDMLLRKVLLPK